MYKKIFLFLFLIAFTSCGYNRAPQNLDDSTKLSAATFISFLERKGVTFDKAKNILVIPGVGCTGCISEAQYFFYENKDSKDHIFIFTGINDLKMFKLEVPDSLHAATNVIVDKDNELMDLGYNSIYPGYIRINDDKLNLEIFE